MSRSSEMLEGAATHLDESAQRILQLNDEQRIAYIDRDMPGVDMLAFEP